MPHLRMHSIQWYLKQHWTHTSQRFCHPIFTVFIGQELVQALKLLVVRQAQPVFWNVIQVSHAHHYYYYGCRHGRVECPKC